MLVGDNDRSITAVTVNSLDYSGSQHKGAQHSQSLQVEHGWTQDWV